MRSEVLINVLLSTVTQGSKLPNSEIPSPSSNSATENMAGDLGQRSFLLLDEKENLQVEPGIE